MSALDSLGIASLTILAYLWWRGRSLKNENHEEHGLKALKTELFVTVDPLARR